jgi:hypothetical protein
MLTPKHLNEFDEIDIQGHNEEIMDFFEKNGDPLEIPVVSIPNCVIVYEDYGFKGEPHKLVCRAREEEATVELGWFGNLDSPAIVWEADFLNGALTTLFVEDVIEQYQEHCDDIMSKLSGMYQQVMLYVLYHQDNENVMVRDQKTVSYQHKSRRNKKQKHTVYIRKNVYKFVSSPNSSQRTYERHAGSWSVRGHWRNLSNGKSVWIKPHIKGDGEFDKKTYKLDQLQESAGIIVPSFSDLHLDIRPAQEAFEKLADDFAYITNDNSKGE